MNMRNCARMGALALGLGTLGMTTTGQAAVVEFDIGVAPPVDRVEVVPAPRDGYVYERGH